MSEIVMVGGGIGGLLTAMLLAKDGHDVTVLERDTSAPPEPRLGWDDWDRRGVNQFRLPHFLMPAFHELVDAELPGLTDDLMAAGAYRVDMLSAFTGGASSNPAYESVTARRPVVEAVVAHRAEGTLGVEMRRGVGVEGFIAAPERDGTPHVKGVLTEAGEKIGADLTVVATGRRSALSGWLAGIGARPILEEKEDSGFVYYGRHVRPRDGSPISATPSNVQYGSVSLLVLPGDDGTAGVGLIGLGDDHQIRDLRKAEVWNAVVSRLPLGEAILDAESISPQVFMGGLEDRWCRTSPEGVPAATGVVAVFDAFSATNPSLGRGITLGLRSAVALRDSLREAGDHPREICAAYDQRLKESLTPWYRATVWSDRNRLEQCRAAIDNRPAQLDPAWVDHQRIGQLPGKDPGFLPRLLDHLARLSELPDQIASDPQVVDLLDGFDPEAPPEVFSRSALLELIDTHR